ncbi:MAG: DUF1949 domain-containing protein [Gemmatimonadetes bacterium]|nr:MAG: DUF1949 domain-containing protein [Gemmatimonadota bacterium]
MKVDPSDNFKTLANEPQVKVTEKRSRFFGWARRVNSEAEIDAFLAEVRQTHHNPTHIVYAYRLKIEDTIREYCTDDGEPTYSAGKPVLSVLQKYAVVNGICAVIRYFGGVKLGVGGLIRAYGGTAEACLELAQFQTVIQMTCLQHTVPYAGIGKALHTLEKLGGTVDHIDYGGTEVVLHIQIRKSQADQLKAALNSR